MKKLLFGLLMALPLACSNPSTDTVVGSETPDTVMIDSAHNIVVVDSASVDSVAE